MPTKTAKSSVEELADSAENKPKNNIIRRAPTGIFGMDELIEGGFEVGTTVLLTGGPGTGKTTFALQFLYYGATKFHEPAVLITFEESGESLYKHSMEYGWDFAKLEKEKMFRILEYKPHQVNKLMEEGGGPIRDAIKSIGAKRLVIDSVTAYALLFKDEYEKRESLLEFFGLLHKWGCTSLIVSEVSASLSEVRDGTVNFLTDAIIALSYEKKSDQASRVHSLEVLKMRGTQHSNKVCAMMFERDGIRVYPDVEIF